MSKKVDLSAYAYLDDHIDDLEKKLAYSSKDNILNDMKKYGMDELLFLDDDINQKAKNLGNKNNDSENENPEISEKEENLLLKNLTNFFLEKDLQNLVQIINEIKNEKNMLKKKKCLENVLLNLKNKHININTYTIFLLIIKSLLYFCNNKLVHLVYLHIKEICKEITLENIDYISSLFWMDIISVKFLKSLFEILLEKNNFRLILRILKNNGIKIRNKKPSVILYIDKLLNEKEIKDEEILQVMKKIKNNLKVKTILPYNNFSKEKKKLKMIFSENPEKQIRFSITYKELKKLDISENWEENYYIKKNQKQEKKSNEILDKFEKKNKKLFTQLKINSEFEKIIIMIILKSENFKKASKKLKQIIKSKTEKQILVRLINSLLLNEKNFNMYYIYLIQELVRIIDDIQYTFYYYYWRYFKRLDNQENLEFDKKSNKKICLLFNELFLVKCFDMKLLKHFDFMSIEDNQKSFLRIFFKIFLVKVNTKFIQEQMTKMNKNNSNLTFIDEFKDFCEIYGKKFFEIDFKTVTAREREIIGNKMSRIINHY